MNKLGPLKKGYWQVEFPSCGGMVVTELVNGPLPGMNHWIRLWCDGCYLEGNDWSDLKIIVNTITSNWLIPDPKFILNGIKVCECGGDKVNSGHSGWCPKYV